MMLSLRPDYELVTRYSAVFGGKILSTANNVGLSYKDLYKENATLTNFSQSLTDVNIINIYGHGDYNSIYAQDGELLLRADYNDDLLTERVVFDLSCRAGRNLGSSSVERGAVSFLGYNEDFWLCYTYGDHSDGGLKEPLMDEVAKAFMNPHNTAPESYIKGYSLSESFQLSQSSIDYWIRNWEQKDSNVAALLTWNKDHQVLKPAKLVEKKFPIAVILLIAPLLLIPLIRKFKKRKV